MTTFYPYILLLHIVGAIGMFIAISLELIVMSRLRASKTTVQVHEWLSLHKLINVVLPISAALLLISGLVLTFSVWGWGHAWIELSLGLLILVGILSPVINTPRLKAIHAAAQAAPEGEITPALREAIFNRTLQVYLPIPGFIALGAVLMMVLKLDWTLASLLIALIVIISVVYGLTRKA